MNLQQLRYLVEIADCHSLTKASKKLFVSQPYLSKVVADFEAKVHHQIFIRYNNGLELTTYGKKVYLLAQSIISQMERLEHLETEETDENNRVKLSFSVGNLILKDSLLLDYVSTAHATRIDVDFFETTIEGCIKQVEEEISEFAILVVDDFQKTLLKSVSARKGLECIELDEGCLYYHFHRNHSLANQENISMDSLMQYPFVQLKSDEYTAFSNEKWKEEFPNAYMHKCIVVNHYHSCLMMVKNSNAFMVGNKWQISELEKMGIQSIRLSSINRKAYLIVIKKEITVFSSEAKKFLHLFKSSYGLDKT